MQENSADGRQPGFPWNAGPSVQQHAVTATAMQVPAPALGKYTSQPQFGKVYPYTYSVTNELTTNLT